MNTRPMLRQRDPFERGTGTFDQRRSPGAARPRRPHRSSWSHASALALALAYQLSPGVALSQSPEPIPRADPASRRLRLRLPDPLALPSGTALMSATGPRHVAADGHVQSSNALGLRSERLAWGELRPLTQPNYSVPIWHSLGLLVGMRLSEAVLWPETFAETRLSVIGDNYAEAFTRPPKWDSRSAAFEWDGDPWSVNVIGHGLMGAELYYRPRACGHGVLASLGFVTAGTLLWDYGFEASGVRPSGVDLWYTPLSGMVIGEMRYWGYRAASDIDDVTWRAVVQTLFDPFGQIERALGAGC